MTEQGEGWHSGGLVDIYAFDDFREFLGATYRSKKENNPNFSFRSFSKRTGFSAPNHLQRVIAGQRNLSPNAVERYAMALQLNQEETDYFRLLVSIGQEEDEEDKESLRRSLLAMKKYRQAERLGDAHARYHSCWYIPAIFEMVACRGFVPEPRWIARRLCPSIESLQAQEALSILEDLGLIEIDGGEVRQKNSVLTTGAEVQRTHIADYHRVMMDRAAASIDEVAPGLRDISSLTVALGPVGLQSFKARIQEFRRELLSLAEEQDDPSQVVQLNLQLFPLSKQLKPET
ncbi:MAG: TIGR02147 family protein [Polyangiaceae bacterium]|nr:TIGR02147 family protein [Polyangiaceae bacterium]